MIPWHSENLSGTYSSGDIRPRQSGLYVPRLSAGRGVGHGTGILHRSGHPGPPERLSSK